MDEPTGDDATGDTTAGDTAADETAYGRPDGVQGGFEPRHTPQVYRRPPPTVAPEDARTYSRPGLGDAAFAPQSGERLEPRHAAPPPVPNVLRDTFGTTPDAAGGFAPQPGTRLGPTGRAAESPWWKPDAAADPWRDPNSPFWLGRGAVFTGGRPAQLDPSLDTATDSLDGGVADPSATGVDEELDDDPGRDNVRRMRFGLPTLAVTLVVAVVAGLVGGGAGWLITRTTAEGLHRPDITIPTVEGPSVARPPTSVAGIARRVGPTVVSIAVRTPSEYAIGSGVVIDSSGDVLTNNHVVAAAAGVRNASIVVTFSDEDTAEAQIVGRDPTSDLAVVRVPNDQLTVARLGDSAELAVGDPVIAIGSPLGLQGTVTAGIVSALNRPVHVYADDGTSDAYLDAIQTDAPINPGNSGGALVDSAGAVIGINSAAAQGSSGGTATTGIGYAIPIDYARTIATELIRTGKAVHATFGAQGRTVLAGVHVGGYLVQVSPNGPAAKAGLRAGDVIVSAGGTVVQTYDQLVVLVQQRKPGDRLSVTYYPDGGSQTRTATVVLG